MYAKKMVEQEETEEYKAFVEKFKPKKTTDDCYTPSTVYDAVADWVAEEYKLDRANFVRPFYPGGDYQAYNYKETDVVVDNPPFSIFSQIIKWYHKHDIKFFLFAPALTLFSTAIEKSVCYMPIGVDVVYENGANVRTSFVTSLDKYCIRTSYNLYQKVQKANDENIKQSRVELPKYVYPDYIVTAALAQKWCHYGIDFCVKESECVRIRSLDAQKRYKKTIYGGAFLLSERAAAERAAAIKWELSDRELEIVRKLSGSEGSECTRHTQ